MRIREVNFFGAIESKILMEDKEYCYLEAYYEERKSIYRYDKEEESITEIISTSDFGSMFFVDDYSKKIYEYSYKSGELVIKEILEYEIIEIFRENMGKRKDIKEIVALNNHIFIKLKRKNNFIEAYVYSIDHKEFYEILDRPFIETINEFFIIERENELYLALEESYHDGYEILEIRKSHGNSELSRNNIVLYNFNRLMREIKGKKVISKSLFIDSVNNEYVELLGVFKNKAVVFQNKEKKRLLCFSVDDSVELRTLEEDVTYIVKKESLLLVKEKGGNIKVFNRDNKVLFLYEGEGKEEKITIRAFIKGRFLIYSKNNLFGDKSMNIYDSFTEKTKSFNCDFIMIDKELI